MNRPSDGYELQRFEAAQASVYATALEELRGGRKRSHWMWFVFPQLEGLGSSPMARRYAISGRAEAEAYIRHPVLGPRLVECFEAVLAIEGRSVHEIFGSPDDLKLRSCATLFAAVAPAGSVFQRVLEKYYVGEPDVMTLERLNLPDRGCDR